MPLIDRGGTWYYRFQYKGKAIVKTTGLAAIKRNVSAANQQEADHRNRLRGLPAGSDAKQEIEGIEIEKAYAEYIEWKEGEHRDHPNTAKRIRGSFVSLLKFFKEIFVHTIQPGDIERFKTYRRGKGGPVKDITIRHDLHALSDFLQYAKRQQWIKHNPMVDIEIPSDADAVRDYVLSPIEERRYFSAALVRSVDLHDLGRLIIDQGFRPEEVERFAIFDYKPELGKIHVRTGKSKAAKRTILLTPESRAIVERRVQEAKNLGTPWLFPSPKNPKQHIWPVNKAHEDVRMKTGLYFTLYELRHTFATRMGEQGVSAPVLAKLLGHGSLRCVLKYCHIGDNAADEAMRASKPEQATGTKLLQIAK